MTRDTDLTGFIPADAHIPDADAAVEIEWCIRALTSSFLRDIPSGSLGYTPTSLREFHHLTSSEHEFAQQFSSTQRRDDFLRGRTLLHSLLEQQQRRQQQGSRKQEAILPHPLGYPRLPTPFIGTLSHKKGHVVAVVAKSEEVAGVGVDIEHAVSPAMSHRLARWLGLSLPSTTHESADAAPQQWAHQALADFSARESAVKAITIAFQELVGVRSLRIKWGEQTTLNEAGMFQFWIPESAKSLSSGRNMHLPDQTEEKPLGFGRCSYSDNWLVTYAAISAHRSAVFGEPVP